MTYRAQIGLAAVITTALVSATDAPAGEPGSLTFEGYIELEYLNGEFDDTFLVGDVWVRYTAPSGLGFDAGLVAFSDFDDSEHALYAAVTYSFGDSKISVGVPRPAYDTFSNFPAVGGLRTFELALGNLNGDIPEFVYLLGDTDPPLGVRYDGEFGPLQVAASAHRFDDDLVEADAFAIALRYDVTSNVALLADWERFLPDGGPGVTTTRAGTQLQFSSWESGLAYFNRDFDAAPHIDGTETWVTYMPTSEIDVTATALNTNVFDVLGLSLRYERMMGDSEAAKVYGQIGVADGRGFDTTFDLSVGLQF